MDEDPTDAVIYYQDRDSDGFGNDHNETLLCEAPSSGYVTVGGDCDDNSADINPDATESCDGVDEDCDGYIDSSDACDGCYIDWYEEHAYLFCAYDVWWFVAEASCGFGGYSIVTVNSEDENDFLTDIAELFVDAGYTNYWWLGYTDQGSEGDFYWASGSSSYENWNSGEPNNSGNEDCVELYPFGEGRWNDISCWDTNYFVCEAG